jgi:protein-disulfide isomerase
MIEYRRKKGILGDNCLIKIHMNRNLIIWGSVGVLVVLVVVGMIVLVRQPGAADGIHLGTPAPVHADDWKEGALAYASSSRTATIIEYADFQCPACGAYHPIVKKLLADRPTTTILVYRNFPLFSIHANADIAAQSAEAAGKQNKFWEMHDMIFEHQADWEHLTNDGALEVFVGYAKTLQLDEAKFRKDAVSNEVRRLVNDDIKSAREVGVFATPTFFINGVFVKPQSYDEFIAAVDAVGAATSTAVETVATTTFTVKP